MQHQAIKQNFEANKKVTRLSEDFLTPPQIINPPFKQQLQLGGKVVLVQTNRQNNQQSNNLASIFPQKFMPSQPVSPKVNQHLNSEVQKNLNQQNQLKNVLQQNSTKNEKQQSNAREKISVPTNINLTRSVQQTALPSSDIIMFSDFENSPTGL